jgi:hypothetical protein
MAEKEVKGIKKFFEEFLIIVFKVRTVRFRVPIRLQ